MKTSIVMVVAILAAGSVFAAPPKGRLLKVPKVYNALITSDIPLLPSRAETAATAAVGPVLLYSELPVVLQPQLQGVTPQNHLDKLTQLQNQLQREDLDQQRQIQLPRCCVPQAIGIPVAVPLQPLQQELYPEHQQPAKQLYPEPTSLQQSYPVKQLSAQQQLYPERQLPVPVRQDQQPLYSERRLPVRPEQPPYPEHQLPVRPEQQPLYPERQLPVPVRPEESPYPERQLPVQVRQGQPLYSERQLPVQQLYPESQQLAGSHRQPLQVQQVPVQHLSREHLSQQQYDVPYQKHPVLQQQYPTQIDVQRQKLQHQKQLQLQLQQQKQLQLSQFQRQQKEEQDTSYLPMPEMHSYQPPPSVHIDDIKNNKPSNAAIPDVPPPPLPVGKRLQSYSYNSPVLSPPPPTNHHVPYG